MAPTKTSNTVPVYADGGKGKLEHHTPANARDLVQGAGYSWTKKADSTPAARAPYAVPEGKKFAKTRAQEILDKVGGSNIAHESDALEGDEEDEVEEVVAAPVRKPRTPRVKPTPVADPPPEPEAAPEDEQEDASEDAAE